MDSHIDEIVFTVPTGSTAGEGIDHKLMSLEDNISMTQEEIGRLLDALQGGMSPTIVARIRELESTVAQAERVQDELLDCKHRHGKVPGA